MTNKEIANWVRGWMSNHPKCGELDSMYEDFFEVYRYGAGQLTKLIWKINPLKYMSYIPKGMFCECEDMANLIIPDNIKSISGEAFSGCDGLTRVTIPNSVESIGEYAFWDCPNLTSVTIGNGAKTVVNNAFSGCTSLTSITVDESNTAYKSINGNLYSKDGKTLIQYAIGKTDTSFTIPDSVKSIGDYAFYGCTGLTSITIPDSVTDIGKGAFDGCTVLTEINFSGTKSQWNSVTLGYEWNSYSGIKSIKCTDGIITV